MGFEFPQQELLEGLKAISANPASVLRPDRLYLNSSDPLLPILILCLWVVTLTALLGIVTNEYSWVDRIWAIVPFVYIWLFTLHPCLALKESFELTSRLTLMALLTTLWGLRLTYNFWRKGGYAPGGEDYRWIEVRKWFNAFTWQLFNIGFIAFYQNVLLWLITLPAYVAWIGRNQPLGPWDAVAAGGYLSLLLLETVSDQQQWQFQTTKYAKKAAKEPLTGEYADGFLQSGLFKYSRHPSFFAEFSMWWSIYLFTYPASDFEACPFNWTITGAVLLTLLFQGSTDLTEKLSCRKYPKYAEYQQRVSRLTPWFPSGRVGGSSKEKKET